ncbi:MAG: beta-lactamase family protein, partial [Clostridia bacterium]|nr:beta-lactamase family protein [Clostridia bacterium]
MYLSKLKEIDRITERRIGEAKLAGAAYAVAVEGRTVFENALGCADVENRVPFRTDTVVRLASMTKPVTCAAVLMMAERGALSLSDPVSRFIPEFANPNVAITDEKGRVTGIRPAKNKITVRDLLNHTSGLGSGPAGDAAWNAYRLREGATLASSVPVFAFQPLDFEPRTEAANSWTQAFDLAAYLVELLSGTDFESFVTEKLLYPLGCFDTVFTPGAEQRSRMMKLYDARDGKLIRIDTGKRIFGAIPSTYHSGGAGLAGTLDDYMKFAAMLCREGETDGVRVLSAESVKLMSTPSLPFEIPTDCAETWGLAMRVTLRQTAAQPLFPGSYGWSGAYGTHLFVDPAHRVSAVYVPNLLAGGGAGADTA